MGQRDRGKWLVALSCCFINCMLYGVSRLSGMLLIPLVNQYSVSRASASLPFSICSCIRNLAGPFAGQLSQYFGIRQVAIFGCILATVGSSLCCYADNMLETTIFWGGIFGTGLGISTTLMPLAINQNFSTYQSTASGISYSGAFLGSFLFPPLLTYAIYEYGLSGSFLIISGVMLNSLAAAMFLRSSARTKANETPNCKGERKRNVVAYSKSKTDKSDSSLRSRSSVMDKGKGQHDNRILISPNDLTFPESNVGESKYEPSDILKYFRSGTVNTSNKTHVSDDKLGNLKRCVITSQCLDCNENVSPLVEYNDPTKSENALRNGCPNHLTSQFTQINEVHSGVEDAKKNNVQSSSDILAFTDRMTEIDPVYILNLNGDVKNLDNTDMLRIPRNTVYQKCAEYLTLIKGSLGFNVASYSLAPRRERAIYDIHEEYLKERNVNPLRKNAKYFGNIAIYNFDMETKDTNVEVTSYKNIIDDLTELSTERHPPNPVKGDLSNPSGIMESINGKVYQEHKNEHKLLAKTPSHQDYAEPLTHPKIQAMDSFPAYNRLSKRASSFNVLHSGPEISKNFEGCFLEWLKMFTDPVFMSISCTMSLFSFITISILTIIEDFAEDCGVNHSQVYFVLMTMSAADLLGTLSLGWITDKGYVTRSRFTATCFLGIAVIIACFPFTSGLYEILVVVAIYGLLESGVMIMFPLLTAEYINPKRHTIAIASTNLLSSPTMLLVPLAIGYFRDNLGQYDGLFYLLSVISVLCCGVWLFIPLLLHKRHQTM